MTVRPDYRYWALRELWEVRDGAALLLGIHPGSVIPVEIYMKFSALTDIVRDAIDCGTLSPFDRSENYKSLEDRRVRPTDFLIWAKGKGLNIPKELSYLLESDEPEDNEPESPDQEIESVCNAPPGKRERQLQFIAKVIASFGYEPLAIPFSGKAKIKEQCNKEYSLFDGEYSFDHAWKKARKEGLVRTKDHDSYSK